MDRAGLNPDLAAVAAAFGDRLHHAGVPATAETGARFAAAISLTGPTTVRELYWLARVTLVTSHGQLTTFDETFEQVFGAPMGIDLNRSDAPPTRSEPHARIDRDDATDATGSAEAARPAGGAGAPEPQSDDGAEPSARHRASSFERLRDTAFDALTDADRRIVEDLVARVSLTAPVRRGRRTRPASIGSALDPRATLRAAQRTGGDPVTLVHRTRPPRARKVVLLADVSGSMAATSSIYLHLMHRAVREIDAEAFAFATRVHRLTHHLRVREADRAHSAGVAATPDWASGTRIGACLREFLDDHGQRGMARGAVVVIVSDGWDAGDRAVLELAMTRLARMAHRVIWVNPRSAAAGYAPLAGGMSTALPYVDAFLSGHSLAALQEVVGEIASATDAGSGPILRSRPPGRRSPIAHRVLVEGSSHA